MILTFYILRNHFVPFIFSAISLMLIFVVQFLMRFADKLVGKGLDTWVIVQLIMYNLAWMVVLVIPMAVLISVLMAFGRMSQDNEVTVMRSAGISLYRMALPPFLASIVVGYLLLLFNNDVLPDANHRAKLLGQDISQKKPTLSLEPNVFMQDISNYAILARNIEQQSGKMEDLTIYDYTNPNKIIILTAKKGAIYFTPEKSKLLMDLQSGEIHESGVGQSGNLYRKLKFDTHKIALNAEQFTLKQSDDNYRGDRELSAANMIKRIDSLKIMRVQFATPLMLEVYKHFYLDSLAVSIAPIRNLPKDIIYDRAIEKVKSVKNQVATQTVRQEYVIKQINSYSVEVHKKYALPVACIIFVLLGAPMGVMTRKGGFGMAASISLFFFLIYWAFLIGGEKLADRSIVTPFWGMWAANILMGSLGAFLIYRSVRDNITLDLSFFSRLIPKKWRATLESNENS